MLIFEFSKEVAHTAEAFKIQKIKMLTFIAFTSVSSALNGDRVYNDRSEFEIKGRDLKKNTGAVAKITRL